MLRYIFDAFFFSFPTPDETVAVVNPIAVVSMAVVAIPPVVVAPISALLLVDCGLRLLTSSHSSNSKFRALTTLARCSYSLYGDFLEYFGLICFFLTEDFVILSSPSWIPFVSILGGYESSLRPAAKKVSPVCFSFARPYSIYVVP